VRPREGLAWGTGLLRAAWLAFWSGVALAVFSANMLGDALRDTLDPRLRGTG
jgi:ABC-type dipeptide/oligopeptide/nickel transport system permease subunit